MALTRDSYRAIRKLSLLIYSQSWVWELGQHCEQAMNFTLIFSRGCIPGPEGSDLAELRCGGRGVNKSERVWITSVSWHGFCCEARVAQAPTCTKKTRVAPNFPLLFFISIKLQVDRSVHCKTLIYWRGDFCTEPRGCAALLSSKFHFSFKQTNAASTVVRFHQWDQH